METVLITGGTGLVGKALTTVLLKEGFRVIILSRKKAAPTGNDNLLYATWNVTENKIDITALQQADYIIHLAGAGVMDKKWSETYKQEIINSRVQSAALVTGSLKNNPNKVKAVISASAIGWYKATDNLHTEEEPADDSFLGTTCKLWEQSILPVKEQGIRLVTLRIGIVLDKDGGALKEFMRPLQSGVAAILGNGRQMISWISIHDLCRLFLYALKNETMNGVYNAVAPNPVNNKTLTLILAKKMRRFYLPVYVPSFILKTILGGRSIEILKSTAVSSKKTEAAGFRFKYENIDGALEYLLKN